MGQAERPTCSHCGAQLILALPPGGKGPRTLQCFECDGPDPLKTDKATGWLKGELHPPKWGRLFHRFECRCGHLSWTGA